MSVPDRDRRAAPTAAVRGAVACGALALWMTALLFGWVLGGLAHLLLGVALVATPWRGLVHRLVPPEPS